MPPARTHIRLHRLGHNQRQGNLVGQKRDAEDSKRSHSFLPKPYALALRSLLADSLLGGNGFLFHGSYSPLPASALHIESEVPVADVPILDHVFFSFESHFSGGLHGQNVAIRGQRSNGLRHDSTGRLYSASAAANSLVMVTRFPFSL